MSSIFEVMSLSGFFQMELIAVSFLCFTKTYLMRECSNIGMKYINHSRFSRLRKMRDQDFINVKIFTVFTCKTRKL